MSTGSFEKYNIPLQCRKTTLYSLESRGVLLVNRHGFIRVSNFLTRSSITSKMPCFIIHAGRMTQLHDARYFMTVFWVLIVTLSKSNRYRNEFFKLASIWPTMVLKTFYWDSHILDIRMTLVFKLVWKLSLPDLHYFNYDHVPFHWVIIVIILIVTDATGLGCFNLDWMPILTSKGKRRTIYSN